MADQLAELEENRVGFSSQLMDLSDKSEQMEERLRQLNERLSGAKGQVQNLLQAHRRSAGVGPDSQTDLEIEMNVIEQRSTNRALMEGLSQLAATDQQLAIALEKQMAEAGIPPPTTDPDLDDDGDDDGDYD